MPWLHSQAVNKRRPNINAQQPRATPRVCFHRISPVGPRSCTLISGMCTCWVAYQRPCAALTGARQQPQGKGSRQRQAQGTGATPRISTPVWRLLRMRLSPIGVCWRKGCQDIGLLAVAWCTSGCKSHIDGLGWGAGEGTGTKRPWGAEGGASHGCHRRHCLPFPYPCPLFPSLPFSSLPSSSSVRRSPLAAAV